MSRFSARASALENTGRYCAQTPLKYNTGAMGGIAPFCANHALRGLPSLRTFSQILKVALLCLTVEAVHIANQLCQYGYFFPVNDSKTLTVKDDSSLYRFQVSLEKKNEKTEKERNHFHQVIK